MPQRGGEVKALHNKMEGIMHTREGLSGPDDRDRATG